MGFLIPCLLLFLLCLASFLNYLAQGQVERCGGAFGGRVCGVKASAPNGVEYKMVVHYANEVVVVASLVTVEAPLIIAATAAKVSAYCGGGCQSQCNGGVVSNINSSLFDELLNISSSQFDEFLKHRNDRACPGKNFYTYDAFLAATHSFNGFTTTGNSDTRKREITAFFAQTSIGRCGDEPTISFKTALSFWMTSQSPKPSCHDVITGKWIASASDKDVGRVPGFGLITNIMSGGV